ncbi:hypothetical protein FXE63_15690 [Vibrio mimicus]|nr:hypothetical protein FXE63_15690 [Vibrio mimicus]
MKRFIHHSLLDKPVFYPWLQYRYLSQNGSAVLRANGLYLKKNWLDFEGYPLPFKASAMQSITKFHLR